MFADVRSFAGRRSDPPRRVPIAECLSRVSPHPSSAPKALRERRRKDGRALVEGQRWWPGLQRTDDVLREWTTARRDRGGQLALRVRVATVRWRVQVGPALRETRRARLAF